MDYQLPSSFQGGMQGAISSLQSGKLPTANPSVVPAPQQGTNIPQKKEVFSVQLPDGRKVQFDHKPTPQELDELDTFIKQNPYTKPDSLPRQMYTKTIDLAKKIPGVGMDIAAVGGIAQGAAKMLGYASKLGNDIFGTEYGNTYDKYNAGVDKMGSYLTAGTTEENPFSTWVGEQVPAVFAGGAAGKLAGGIMAGGGELLGGLPETSKFISSVASKYPKLAGIAEKYGLGKATASSVKGVADVAGYNMATGQKPINANSALGLLPFIKPLGKVTSEITGMNKESILNNLHLDSILSPTAQQKITDIVSPKSVEGGIDQAKKSLNYAREWLARNNISGGLSDIRKQAVAIKDNGLKALDTFYTKISSKPGMSAVNRNADDLLSLFNQNSKNLTDSASMALKDIENSVRYNNGQWTPKNLHDLKQLASSGEAGKIWNNNGGVPPVGSAAQMEEKALGIKSDLEQVGKKFGVDVESINNDIQVSDIISKDTFKRSFKKEDILKVGGGGMLSVATYYDLKKRGVDPTTAFVTAFVVGATGGAALRNPKIATLIASKLQKSTGAEQTALKAFMDSNGKVGLPDALMAKLIKGVNNGMELYTKNAEKVSPKAYSEFSDWLIANKKGMGQATQAFGNKIVRRLSLSPTATEVKNVMAKLQTESPRAKITANDAIHWLYNKAQEDAQALMSKFSKSYNPYMK